MITLISSLHSCEDYLEESISFIQETLSKYPEGRLVSYYESGKYIRYKILIPGKKPVNVSKKDHHKLIRMTRKLFLEAQLSQQKADLFYCRSMVSDLAHIPQPGTSFPDDPGISLIVRQYGLFEDLDDWSRADFKRNPSHPENLIIDTPAGFRVRSKAEYIIVMILIELGIPFRYEAELILNNGEIWYPDFMLRHPVTGKIYIVEHFGLMSDKDYKNNAWNKIRIYDENGFRQDDNLICFYEYADKPLNPMYVRDTFKRLVLN